MQLLTSSPIESALTAVQIILTLLCLIGFLFSLKRAFRSFVLLALSILTTLFFYWSDQYHRAELRDDLVQPVLVGFVKSNLEVGLSITGLSWNGRILSHDYSAARLEVVPSRVDAKKQTCTGSVRVGLLALGGIIEHSFDVRGSKTINYRFSVRDCFEDG